MTKPLEFVGSSRDDLSAFPEQARREAGFQLWSVQEGLAPSDWKPLNTVGSGAMEIRIRTAEGAWRVIYVAKFEAAVYVLHAFEKKEQKTRQADIDLAKKRYQEIAGKP
jgi:phage-related protein